MMKERSFRGIMVMLMALVGITAYGNDTNLMDDSDVNRAYDFSKAIGITWKLSGFGTVGEDEVQKVKPEKGDDWWKDEQYTILFKEDGTLKGHTFSNDFFGEYSIDGNTLFVGDLWATEIGEEYDGGKYYAALYSPLIHVFEIRDNQLLLYYNEGQNYLLFLAVQTTLFAEEYYPEGTKWTEIRLDTLKYDSWYSKVGDEWVPNFETIKYYVKGEYKTEYGERFKCIYTSGPEWTDSLTLGIKEGELIRYNEKDEVMVTVFVRDYYGAYIPWGEAMVYQFDWSVGKGLYFQDILYSNTTSIGQSYNFYGIIDEIKEGYFGGVRPLKYVDLDGKAPADKPSYPTFYNDTKGGRIIQGIGITEWDDGECLFGPPNPYNALGRGYNTRHYRSRLVHFERNGEVLYDVWPEKGGTDGIKSINNVKSPIVTTVYDLYGRKMQQSAQKGVFIQNGRKYIVK